MPVFLSVVALWHLPVNMPKREACCPELMTGILWRCCGLSKSSRNELQLCITESFPLQEPRGSCKNSTSLLTASQQYGTQCAARTTSATVHWAFSTYFPPPHHPEIHVLVLDEAQSCMFCCKEFGFILHFYSLPPLFLPVWEKKKHLKFLEYQEHCRLLHQKKIACL